MPRAIRGLLLLIFFYPLSLHARISDKEISSFLHTLQFGAETLADTQKKLIEEQVVPRSDIFWEKRPLDKVDTLVIHHTVFSQVSRIFKLHTHSDYLQANGAPFITYHFLILKDGRVWWANPVSSLTYHAGRLANPHTIGIALLGNLDRKPPTDLQLQSLKKLIDALHTAFNRPLKLSAHKEVGTKETRCPGRHGMKWLENTRLGQKVPRF